MLAGRDAYTIAILTFMSASELSDDNKSCHTTLWPRGQFVYKLLYAQVRMVYGLGYVLMATITTTHTYGDHNHDTYLWLT